MLYLAGHTVKTGATARVVALAFSLLLSLFCYLLAEFKPKIELFIHKSREIDDLFTLNLNMLHRAKFMPHNDFYKITFLFHVHLKLIIINSILYVRLRT